MVSYVFHLRLHLFFICSNNSFSNSPKHRLFFICPQITALFFISFQKSAAFCFPLYNIYPLFLTITYPQTTAVFYFFTDNCCFSILPRLFICPQTTAAYYLSPDSNCFLFLHTYQLFFIFYPDSS